MLRPGVLTISGSYVEEFLRSAVVSYVQGLLLPRALALRGYYPKGFLCARVVYIQGCVVTFIGSYLKGFSYVQGLLLSGVLTFRRFYVVGVITLRVSYVQGFLRPVDLTSRDSYVQRFLCSGDFTSIDSYVQVVLHPGFLTFKGSYIQGI